MLRIGVLLAVATMAGTVLAGGGSAGAYNPPVVAPGQIQCQITGKISFTPKLVFNGTTPTVARYKATTGYCHSGPEFIDQPPAGITGAKVTGSFHLPTNDCGSHGNYLDGGPSEFTAKWQAPGHRVVKTTVGLSSVIMVINDVSFDYPLFTSYGLISKTGSFPGTISGMLNATMYSLKGDVATMCQPKTQGVPGSGGLKRLEFGGGDSFFALEDGSEPLSE